MGKGEIVQYEQFLLFPQCFQKTFTTDMQKPGLVWENVKPFWKHKGKRRQVTQHQTLTGSTTYVSLANTETANCCWNNPLFLRVCSPSHLKTLWEKEKLLAASNIYFPCVFSTL